MKFYKWNDVIEKSGLDIQTLHGAIESFSLPIEPGKIDESLSVKEYLMMRRVADIIKQDLLEDDQKQKIARIKKSLKSAVTISDVALEAEVSTSSVSTILNNRESNIKVGEETRQRILEAAQRLGYKANPVASALRKRQTGVIGAVVRDIGDPFLRQLTESVQVACNKEGVDLLISHAMHEAKVAQRQVNYMLNHWFDGLIFIGDMIGDGIIFDILANQSLPAISLAGRQKTGVSTIGYDDDKGIRLMWDHLYGLGHRRIAFLGNKLHTSVKNRLESFRRLHHELDTALDETLIFTPTSIQAVVECVKTILSLDCPPTAILCASDYYAQFAIYTVLQMGWKIPEDITIVGYDYISELRELYVPLTTIRQPTELAAEQALSELMEQIRSSIAGEKCLPNSIVISPELIISKSSGPATQRRKNGSS